METPIAAFVLIPHKYPIVIRSTTAVRQAILGDPYLTLPPKIGWFVYSGCLTTWQTHY